MRITSLSSPVVEVWDGVLLVPLVGTLDDQRAAQMSSALLEAVRRECAQAVLVDITGCTVVDTYTAAHLINTVRSVRLLGAATVITGVSAHVAADLVKRGVERARGRRAARARRGVRPRPHGPAHGRRRRPLAVGRGARPLAAHDNYR